MAHLKVICCLKWDSCHPASKLCERKQVLHNEPLTVGHTVNLVTRTAGVPVVYCIVLCGYCITSVLSVIASLSMPEKSCTSTSLLPVFRDRTAVVVRIEDPPRFFPHISHTLFFPSYTHPDSLKQSTTCPTSTHCFT